MWYWIRYRRQCEALRLRSAGEASSSTGSETDGTVRSGAMRTVSIRRLVITASAVLHGRLFRSECAADRHANVRFAMGKDVRSVCRSALETCTWHDDGQVGQI